jgi:hypothetical protein
LQKGAQDWKAELEGSIDRGGGIDLDKWEAIKAATNLPRGCARLLARFACGMSSPHITVNRLSKHPLYGSMADHDFKAILKVCFADLWHRHTKQ